jgi:hypothetical protein
MESQSKRIAWSCLKSLVKGTAVLCAFLAFGISVRQKEFERFAEVKPVFEISSNRASREFSISNYGGLVFFMGGRGSFEMTPRQFTALPSEKSQKGEMKFALKDGNPSLGPTYLYWKDVDFNIYEMKIGVNRGEYFIDGAPPAKRSPIYYTMSWHWLDWVFNRIFQKEWFEKVDVPQDNALVVVSN